MIKKEDIVLVTGATGFTGSHLVRLLHKTGCRLRVIARHSSDRSQLEDLNIQWYLGNVYDPKIVEQAVDGVNFIFHAAAAYREAKISDAVYQDVHVVSTKWLAKEAAKQNNFKRFVHVSTVGVLGHVTDPPADETTPYNPGDIYQKTKAEAEQWIVEFAKTTQLPLTVVRPAAIYGPGDRRLLKLFKLAKLPLVPLVGYSKGLYHLIHVDDLIAFMIYIACQPQGVGKIFICASPQPISIKSIIEHIAHTMGKKAHFIRLPAGPIFLLAFLCEKVCKPIGIEPPIFPRRVAFYTKDRAFSTKNMQAAGFKTQVSDENGLSQLYQWYRAKGWI